MAGRHGVPSSGSGRLLTAAASGARGPCPLGVRDSGVRPSSAALWLAAGSALHGRLSDGLGRTGSCCGFAAVRAPSSQNLPFLPKPDKFVGAVCGAERGHVCIPTTVCFLAPQLITLPGMESTAGSLQAAHSAPATATASFVFDAGFVESASYGGELTLLGMIEGDQVPGDFNFGSVARKGKCEKQVCDMPQDAVADFTRYGTFREHWGSVMAAQVWGTVRNHLELGRCAAAHAFTGVGLAAENLGSMRCRRDGAYLCTHLPEPSGNGVNMWPVNSSLRPSTRLAPPARAAASWANLRDRGPLQDRRGPPTRGVTKEASRLAAVPEDREGGEPKARGAPKGGGRGPASD